MTLGTVITITPNLMVLLVHTPLVMAGCTGVARIISARMTRRTVIIGPAMTSGERMVKRCAAPAACIVAV